MQPEFKWNRSLKPWVENTLRQAARESGGEENLVVFRRHFKAFKCFRGIRSAPFCTALVNVVSRIFMEILFTRKLTFYFLQSSPQFDFLAKIRRSHMAADAFLFFHIFAWQNQQVSLGSCELPFGGPNYERTAIFIWREGCDPVT